MAWAKYSAPDEDAYWERVREELETPPASPAPRWDEDGDEEWLWRQRKKGECEDETH